MSERLNLASGLAGSGLVPPTGRPVPSPMPLHSGAPETFSDDDLLACPEVSTYAWIDSGNAVLDRAGRVRYLDESLAQWFERQPAELSGQSFWELLQKRWPVTGPALTELAELQISSTEPSVRELRLPPSNPGSGDSPLRVEVTQVGEGVHVRISSVLPNLTELEEGARDYPRSEPIQRQLFARLVRAEAQLKLLSEQWPGVIFSQRADFSFRFVSPRIEELTGASAAELARQPQLFWRVVHDSDVESVKQQLAQAKASREPMTLTYRIRHLGNGRIVYVMEHRRLNFSPGGLVLGYEGVWLDVTRQTLAERRLSSAAWKETLSVLTMGLAHDFGNVMAGIHALAESFLDQVGPGHEFVEGLNLIKQNSRQASQLVHRIINLHQGQTGERDYHNLNEVITEMSDLIQKIIPRRIRLSLRCSEQSLPVYLDVVELRQVVINLVLNAVDAMGSEGSLRLETHAYPELPPLGLHVGIPPRTPAVGLAIIDDGAGLAPEHLARVFEPFFTTKSSNKGSGLGLYNARMFAERHGGAVTVESPSRGATFRLILPEADFSEGNL